MSDEREVKVWQNKKTGDWYWHEIASSDIVADSNQGYSNKNEAIEQAEKATGIKPTVIENE